MELDSRTHPLHHLNERDPLERGDGAGPGYDVPSCIFLEWQGAQVNGESVVHGSQKPSTTSQVLCDLGFQRPEEPRFTFLGNETWWLSENFDRNWMN